ncbi:MAG TPA: hypothetical protein VGJ60_13050 [Chloroflexota bacterium]|jgi:hypothetical protein
MELLLFIAAVAVVGLLARRFGHDGRDTVYSKEQELASFNIVTDPPADAVDTPVDTRVQVASPRAATRELSP